MTAPAESALDLARAGEVIGSILSPEELGHSERTSAVARSLAERFRLDAERAAYAGLVHDIARAMSAAELLAVARRYELPVSPIDRRRPYLLHGPVGAHLVAEILGVEDQEILAAVASHTFGRVGMSDLEKVVYLADTIEPSRDFPGVEDVRDAALHELDEATRVAYRWSIAHLVKRGRPLHPTTVDVWNWLCLEVAE